jgi:hypothetical protein
MSNFFMDITGLCVFVPKHSTDQNVGQNQMRVLLGDSSGALPWPLPAGASHVHAHELHVPVLLCHREEVDRSGQYRLEDDHVNVAGVVWSVFFLYDQEVYLPNAQPDRLAVTRRPAANGCCNHLNWDSFDWVAPLDRISPGSGQIRLQCITGADPSVLGRALLTDGFIGTQQIAKNGDGTVVDWEFRTPTGASAGAHQNLADVVRYRFPLGTPPPAFEIKTRLFRAPQDPRVKAAFPGGVAGSERTIRLVPTGTDIFTWLKNMPWADISNPKPKPGLRPADFHFVHVYGMSQNIPPPSASNVPFPLPQPCRQGDGQPHAGNPNCPPPQAAPDPHA